MTPRTKKPSRIFPAYLPPNDENPSFEHFAAYGQALAKRVLVIASLVGLVGSGAAFFGVKVLGPSHTAERVAALEDSIGAHNRRITEIERLMRTNIYLSCQVLIRIQPATSIQPQECR